MRTENYVYLISAVRNLTCKVRKNILIYIAYVYFTAAEMYINIYASATNKGTFIAIIQFNWKKVIKNLHSAKEL